MHDYNIDSKFLSHFSLLHSFTGIFIYSNDLHQN